MFKNLSPSKVEALIGFVASIVLAIIPVLANFDWTSTAGVVAGIFGIATIVAKRLEGWKAWENNPQALRELAADPTDTKGYDANENNVDQEAF